MGTVPRFSEHICVAIATDELSDEAVVAYLGAAWPIRVTRWERQAYLTTIRQLRPAVIVVVALEQTLLEATVLLLMALFEHNEPTIASVSFPVPGADELPPPVVIWSLGSGMTAQVAGLAQVVTWVAH